MAIASSLSDVMDEIRTEFIAEYPKIDIQFNTAASGILQRQIEQQAPIDIFASAALEPITNLAKKNLVNAQYTYIFAKNQLVLIQAADNKIRLNTFDDLAMKELTRLAIGNPKTVPAGKYAENALRRSPFLYATLQKEGKLIFGENVRQILTYIINREVDAGLVYQTDISNNSEISIVAVLPEEITEPITYAITPIQSTKYLKESQQFIVFLMSKKGQTILKKYGFLSPMD